MHSYDIKCIIYISTKEQNMKLVIRIFNIVFMAIAATAMICLLTLPTFKVTLGYKMTPEQMAESFPSGGSSSANSGSSTSSAKSSSGANTDVDIKKLIGEDGISLDLSVEISPKLLFNSLTGDAQEVIDKEFIEPNVASIVNSLKEPIHKIGKGMVKILFSNYYISLFESEIDQVKNSDPRSNEDIRIAGGLTNDYFDELAGKTFDAADGANPTVDEVNETMVDCIKEATIKFNNAHTGVTLLDVNEKNKDSISKATREMLKGMNMIKPDDKHIYSISVVMDAMLVDSFSSANNKNSENSANSANQEKAAESENLEEKANKLNKVLGDYIKEMIPTESYETIAKVLKIMLIVLLVFVITWGFYFVYTLLRTLLGRKKIWTFTGPIFWIVGFFQFILGVGLTTAVAVFTSKDFLSQFMGGGSEASSSASEALGNISISIYTSMFVPSILLLILFPTTIVYAVFKGKYKRQLQASEQPAAN